METNSLTQNEIVYRSKRGTPVTDSQKVADVFGKQHKHVLESIRNLLSSAENSAHLNWFYESVYFDVQGKKRPMYVMNRDGFTLLAMGLTGAKAMQFKIGFIEQFNQMEQVIQAAQPSVALPQTLSEALRLAASQAEQIEQQQRQIEAEKPRILFSKSVETSKNSILIGDLAKIIKQNGIDLGQNRLFRWMRENGYLCQETFRNRPTQRAMDMGLFEIREITITKPNGSTLVTVTPKVTGKGQVYFVNKFLYEHQQIEKP